MSGTCPPAPPPMHSGLESTQKPNHPNLEKGSAITGGEVPNHP